MRTLGILLSVLVLKGAVLIGTLACNTGGMRAETGQCPQGEVCSDLTPEGLYFQGTDFAGDFFSDPGLKTTAVGGIQTVRVVTSSSSDTPFTRTFEADLQSGVLAIVAVSPPTVTLKGEYAGSTYLRIVNPFDGLLFDKVRVEAATISGYSVWPLTWDHVDDGPSVLYSGSPVTVGASIRDSLGTRLADESMIIRVVEPNDGRFVQLTWDTIEISGFNPGFVRVAVQTGDGGEHEGTVELTDTVDEVVPSSTYYELPQTMPVGSAQGCFTAISAGRNVLGIPWVFSVTGPVEEWSKGLFPNCLYFHADSPGQVTVTATAAGVSTTVTVQVVAPLVPQPGPVLQLPLSPPPVATPFGADPGMRAAARSRAPFEQE